MVRRRPSGSWRVRPSASREGRTDKLPFAGYSVVGGSVGRARPTRPRFFERRDCLGRPRLRAQVALRWAGRTKAGSPKLASRAKGGTPGSTGPGGALRNEHAGGHRIRVTPVPIPNTEVKPDTADGTARETAWESRSLPAVTFCPKARCRRRTTSGFCVPGRLSGRLGTIEPHERPGDPSGRPERQAV